ncbi:MAG: gliding motility-associated-like protein [Parvicellaceae bacterium]|jgi:gliding motility-associated-like protein
MQKKLLISLFCFSWSIASFGQDIGLLAALSPTSGCEISSTETVTVQVFNYGASTSSSFNVSYKINGGAAVTDVVALGLFPSLTGYTHTFSVSADLSVPGTYTFQLYTSLAGDINSTNDTINGYVVISDANTVGGVVNSSGSVCLSGNSGTLTLTGEIGSILNWEFSDDFGGLWNNISNTTNSESFLNLPTETWYRAIVDNGFCPTDTSSIAQMTIDLPTIGGSLSGPLVVCIPPNSGSVNLSGELGSIVDWESSIDGGVTWSSLFNTTSSESFTNLAVTTWYRVPIQNGSCAMAYSDTVIVNVQAGAVGGIFTSGDFAVCDSANSGTISVNGYSGVIGSWEESTDGGTLWDTIVNSTDSLNYLNITVTTVYRMIVLGCVDDTSNLLTVTVDAMPIGGTVMTDTTVCELVNFGYSNLSGHSGSILDWEKSTNGGGIWSGLGNTTVTNDFSGISTTTMYHAIMGSGVCPNEVSNDITVTVDPTSQIGSVLGPLSVCEIANSDSVYLSGSIGSAINWNESSDAGITWDSVGSGNSHSFINLTNTAYYQVIIQSGVCLPDTGYFNVNVDSITNPGLLSANDTVCFDQNSGTLFLSGNNGVILEWQSSIDGSAWSSIPLTTNNYSYVNILAAEYYRVEVVNGICPLVYSNVVFLDMHPVNYFISSDTTIDAGDQATLTATGGASYSWSPFSVLDGTTGSSVQASPISSTYITIEITDTFGCVYQDSIFVTVLNSQIVIANLITRNGDGLNDVWKISGVEDGGVVNALVFNNNGQVVYQSSNYNNDWSGEYSGGSLPDGTYYYVVNINNTGVEKTGSLDLHSRN